MGVETRVGCSFLPSPLRPRYFRQFRGISGVRGTRIPYMYTPSIVRSYPAICNTGMYFAAPEYGGRRSKDGYKK